MRHSTRHMTAPTENRRGFPDVDLRRATWVLDGDRRLNRHGRRRGLHYLRRWIRARDAGLPFTGADELAARLYASEIYGATSLPSASADLRPRVARLLTLPGRRDLAAELTAHRAVNRRIGWQWFMPVDVHRWGDAVTLLMVDTEESGGIDWRPAYWSVETGLVLGPVSGWRDARRLFFARPDSTTGGPGRTVAT